MNASISKYFGIPYVWEGNSFEGCDCYGLVCLWYKNELGLDLFDYKRPESFNSMGCDYLLGFANNNFKEVYYLQDHDVLQMIDSNGENNHLGIFYKNKVLQSTENTGVTYTRYCFSVPKIVGIFRYNHDSTID